MKLEKELRCMDMALEMGSSVANLGANARPDGSFCVVPPGSSYMSSSSMWTSGILGGAGNTQQQQHNKSHVRTNPQQQQQQGMAGVRSRANHLQSFLGRGSTQPPSSSSNAQTSSSSSTRTAASVQPTQQQGVQITPNASLDQSWWGGGQGSILASSAIAAATPNHRPSPHSGSNNMNENATSDASRQVTASSTNSKQLMQLMDSLNRLGNENAQLMREVEDAKAARAEAKAAKDMMAKFKNEYGQRFNKVKEALTKYNPQTNGAGGADNPVANRYVCALNLSCLLVCLEVTS